MSNCPAGVGMSIYPAGVGMSNCPAGVGMSNCPAGVGMSGLSRTLSTRDIPGGSAVPLPVMRSVSGPRPFYPVQLLRSSTVEAGGLQENSNGPQRRHRGTDG